MDGADVAALAVDLILHGVGIKLLEIGDTPVFVSRTSVESSTAPPPPPPPPGPRSSPSPLTSQSPSSRGRPLCDGYRFEV